MTSFEPSDERSRRSDMSLWLVLPLLLVTLIGGLGGGFVLGRTGSSQGACTESEEVCAAFDAFWQTWNIAEERFVDAEAIDPEQMTAGAIAGMLDSLGDVGHTRYLSAEEAMRWDESLSGSFEGIGAYVDVRDGQTIIVAPIEGSPAERAGVQPGDVVLAVDGEQTTGCTSQELATRVRGPAGSSVRLTIERVGEAAPFDVTVERAEVHVPSVSWRMLPGDVALVRLTSFAADSADDMRRALSEAQEQGAQALILELRNNPGGLLNEAIGVASQFLPRGTPVLLEADRRGQREAQVAVSGGVALDIPLVVLVNGNSASSSEIVAGALQDAERATVVGETTFGTGTVLSTFRLDDGGRLLLGTQQWLTPNGRLIRNQGITPDVEVTLDIDQMPLTPAEAAALDAAQLATSVDAQLARAYELATQAVANRAP
jgi:carboxyl-terminal processing protease